MWLLLALHICFPNLNLFSKQEEVLIHDLGKLKCTRRYTGDLSPPDLSQVIKSQPRNMLDLIKALLQPKHKYLAKLQGRKIPYSWVFPRIDFGDLCMKLFNYKKMGLEIFLYLY